MAASIVSLKPVQTENLSEISHEIERTNMDFKYKKQETYTQDEVDALLDQHAPFIKTQFKGYSSPEDVAKLTDELKPFKLEKRNTHITGLVKDLTDSDTKLNDAISLAGITEEDSDEIITEKVTKVIESRDYLKAEVLDDKASIIKKDDVSKQETKTDQESNFGGY